jgi:hypothetical protein
MDSDILWDKVIKYKTPFTLVEQLELRGMLLSALIRIRRLEEGREELTRMVQELIKEVERVR